MAKAGQQLGLPPELLFRFRVGVEVLFERNPQLESLIVGKVDRAHPALAELPLNPVAVVEDRSSLESHGEDCSVVRESGSITQMARPI